MKLLLAICLTVGAVFGTDAQSSKKVTMKITYKGNPLCNWDVTIKHGDVEIGRGTTDDQGKVDFGTVRLLSNGIDAYGYKKTPNGEKKWDVKGYIALNENGHADFDFLPLVEEMGMPGMIEAAWGLTLNDCGGSSGSSSGSSGTSSSSTTPDKPMGSAEQEAEMDEWEKEQEAKRAEQKAKQDQWNADWESGKTQAEGLQNTKKMQENKIATLGAKIEKSKAELAKLKPGTQEYSDKQYEIRDMEIERSLSELKLEKADKMIANGNAPLSKADRISLETREQPLKAEEDSLKQARKSGALYGAGAQQLSDIKTSEEKTAGEVKQTQETKTVEAVKTTEEPKKEVEKKESDKKESDKKEMEESEDVLKIYTSEEIAALSVVNIKKLKLEANSKITNRKVALKTKSAMMKPEKIKQYEKDIADLQKQIELFDAELAKRKATEETKE